MFKTVLLILFLYSGLVYSCPRCWDRNQGDELIDFTKGNHPKNEKTELKIESEYEKKLGVDCNSGVKKACEELAKILELKKKKKSEETN